MATLTEKETVTYTLTLSEEEARVVYSLVSHVACNAAAYAVCNAFGDDFDEALEVVWEGEEAGLRLVEREEA